MNTRLTIRRPGRAVAVVGAVVAVSAATLMALSTTASAAGSGRCTENVNVRAEPKPKARIVALCEAGKQVQVGEIRNGFVQIKEMNGWAAQEYVSVNGAPPVRSPRATEPSSTNGPRSEESERHGQRHRSGRDGEPGTDSGATASTDADSRGEAGSTEEGTDRRTDERTDSASAKKRQASSSEIADILRNS